MWRPIGFLGWGATCVPLRRISRSVAYAYLDAQIRGRSELLLRRENGTPEKLHIV